MLALPFPTCFLIHLKKMIILDVNVDDTGIIAYMVYVEITLAMQCICTCVCDPNTVDARKHISSNTCKKHPVTPFLLALSCLLVFLFEDAPVNVILDFGTSFPSLCKSFFLSNSISQCFFFGFVVCGRTCPVPEGAFAHTHRKTAFDTTSCFFMLPAGFFATFSFCFLSFTCLGFPGSPAVFIHFLSSLLSSASKLSRDKTFWSLFKPLPLEDACSSSFFSACFSLKDGLAGSLACLCNTLVKILRPGKLSPLLHKSCSLSLATKGNPLPLWSCSFSLATTGKSLPLWSTDSSCPSPI